MQKFLNLLALVMLAWPAQLHCQAPTLPAQPCSPNGTVDVLLIMDASSSVSSSTYDSMRTFAANLPATFNLGPTGVQFSAMTFANMPAILFDFSRYGSGQLNALEQNILSASYTGGRTNTHLALQSALSNSFSVLAGARYGAPHIALVFTEGLSYASSETVRQANLLKSIGVFVVAIGSDNANRAELEALASTPQAVYNVYTDFIYVRDFIREYSNHASCENPVAINSCHGYLFADVIFVLDSSTSIDDVSYNQQLVYVSNVTSNFDLGPDGIRFGAVIFSSGVQTLFDLDDYTHHATLSSAILSAPHLGGGTDTDVALNHVKDTNMFDTVNGGRFNASKVVIVMTDGRSNSQTLTTQAAQRLKDDNVFILAIGVGSLTNPAELRAIASDTTSYFQVAGYDVLDNIFQAMTQELCQLIQVPEKPCSPNGTADVLFIIDSSNGVSTTTYNLMLNFASNLPENFILGPTGIQFGALTFANSPNNLFNFSTYGAGHYKDIQQTILSAPYTGGSTNTQLALQSALSSSFDLDAGARPGAPEVALVFTDGHSTNSAQTISQANLLKAAGVFVVVIGSSSANRAEMNAIASSPQAVYDVATDFRQVRDIIRLYGSHEGCQTPVKRSFIQYSTQPPQSLGARVARAIGPTAGPDYCGIYNLQNGNYPDPDFCFGFIECSNLLTHYFDCPLGLGFNLATRGCDDTHSIDCNANANYYNTLVVG